MNSDTIDLDRAERVVSSLTSDEQRQGYQPKTLLSHEYARSTYLPLFPTKAFGPNDCLLLANVPVTRLAAHELARRQHGAYTSDALMLMNNYQYSSRGDDFSLSEQDAEELAARLRVGKSIITFNASQLRGICCTFLQHRESFRRHVLHKRLVALEEPILNSKQMAMALEFFLQIDVDLFYMKTCSFRGAEPPSNSEEGLFCGNNEPEARYSLLACGHLLCPCCHPPYQRQTSPPWPVVDFASSSTHHFLNGYTTYLNCPATCSTTNVIYAMTCPCGHFDYVDSTAPQTLADAMTYHRRHGNRIIHEKLTGGALFPGMRGGGGLEPSEREKEMTNKMRLYQHSARCPVALRWFLECNPDYWCFIPLLWHDAQADNIDSFRETISPEEDPERPNIVAAIGVIGNPQVTRCLDQIPLPPAAYAFSYPQREQQRLFLEKYLMSAMDELPYTSVDLYKTAIIAVLPDDCSSILRYIIETFFLIHSETKLNMICPLGGDIEKRYGPPYDLVWCTNLNRPFMATATSTQ